MVKAYAALSAKEALKPFKYEAEALKENEVRIKVQSCGICHSDISDYNYYNSLSANLNQQCLHVYVE